MTEKQQNDSVINELYNVILQRREEMPEGAYTTYLFEHGLDKILKKIGEEASEVIIGAKNLSRSEVVYETADLTYHVLVLLAQMEITPAEIGRELERRRNKTKADYGEH